MLMRMFLTAVLVGLMAVAGSETLSEDAHRPVTHPADSSATARLADWTADFISSQKVGDPIRVHALVTFDELLIEQLRNRQIERFAFRVNADHTYMVSRRLISDNRNTDARVTNYDGGWILSGDVDDRNDGSKATLFIGDDGSIQGDVFLKGLGRFIIQPTPERPYHLVFLRTGSYAID
jgi:hypothetical protein